MTLRATFTQAQLTRAIKAADKATKTGIPTKVWVERDGRICLVPMREVEIEADAIAREIVL
jgi:hypothetical protein